MQPKQKISPEKLEKLKAEWNRILDEDDMDILAPLYQLTCDVCDFIYNHSPSQQQINAFIEASVTELKATGQLTYNYIPSVAQISASLNTIIETASTVLGIAYFTAETAVSLTNNVYQWMMSDQLDNNKED